MPGSTTTVADVLDLTIGREGPGGEAWCPGQDARVLTRWIVDRPPELGGAVRRLVRLVRTAALASQRPYALFFYQEMPLLRGEAFRRKTVAAAGVLAGSGVVVEAAGIRFTALAPCDPFSDVAFEISFAQMPRLAALLDVLHNALGYGAVAETLAPILTVRTTASLDDVARRLQSALAAWLTARLESAHHLRQSQAIRRYLAARSAHRPDLIDDERIVELWELQATPSAEGSAGVEGFRLYRSVVQAMLVYRGALADAAAERRLSNAASTDAVPGLLAHAETEAAWALEDEERRVPAALRSVIKASRGAVKWLSEVEIRDLMAVLGSGPQGEGESDASGLAGECAVPAGFERTIFRVEVFAPIQGKLIAALRRKADVTEALARDVAALPQDSYARAAARFGAVAEHLQTALHIAAETLIEAGRLEGVALALELGGREFASELVGTPRRAGVWEEWEVEPSEREIRDVVERARTRYTSAEPTSEVARFARNVAAARRKLKRAGFRAADARHPRVIDTFAASGSAALEVARAVQLLADALTRVCGHHEVGSDSPRFATTLGRLHVE